MPNILKQYLRWDNLNIHVRVAEHSVNTRNSWHRHDDFLELVFVRQGQAVHKVSGKEMPITAGSVFLIREMLDHTYIEPQDMVIYNILFNRDFLHYFDADLRNIPNYQLLFNLESSDLNNQLILEDYYFPEVIKLLDEIIGEQKNNIPGARTMVLANILRVFTVFFRYSHPTEGARGLRNTHIHNISRLLAALESRYHESWTLEKMAAYAKMSTINFRLEFKRLTGISPINHLLKTRLAKASLMLMLPEKTISEIAESCGFNDSNYFTRQFHAEFGMTPRQFRR